MTRSSERTGTKRRRAVVADYPASDDSSRGSRSSRGSLSSHEGGNLGEEVASVRTNSKSSLKVAKVGYDGVSSSVVTLDMSKAASCVSLDRLGDSIVANEDSHVDAVRKGTGTQSAGNEGKYSKSSSSSSSSINIASAADACNQQDDARAAKTKSISPPVATTSATSAPPSPLEGVANISSLRFDAEGIDERVEEIVNGWRSMPPMQPDVFLYKLLHSRGYDSAVIPAREYREPPTEKQISDYDVQLVDAVRLSDVTTLKKLVAGGKSMNACNVHSESILHMAARRSSFETVKFILDNGGDLGIVDDYGRTPLHDACWRNNIRFDVITLLLNCNLDLLRTADIRGACPLSYVREEFWMHWCAYFYHQKEKYWNFELDGEGGGGPKPAPFDPSCCELMGLGTGSKSTAIAAAAAAAAAGAAMKDVTNLDLGLNLDDSSLSAVVASDRSDNSSGDNEGGSSARTRRKTHKAAAAASILASA